MTNHKKNILLQFFGFNATLLSNLADIILLCMTPEIICAVNICDTPLRRFHTLPLNCKLSTLYYRQTPTGYAPATSE